MCFTYKDPFKQIIFLQNSDRQAITIDISIYIHLYLTILYLLK